MADSQESAAVYPSLRRDRQEIRLFSNPACFAGRLETEVREVSAVPSYYALSYAWHEPVPTNKNPGDKYVEIEHDGKLWKQRVQLDLWSFIRNAHPWCSSDILLWGDYICID